MEDQIFKLGEDLGLKADKNLILRAEKEFKRKLELFPKFLVVNDDLEVRDFTEQLCILYVLDEFKKWEERILIKTWGRIRTIIFNGNQFHMIISLYPHKKQIIENLSTRLKELQIYKITDKKTIFDYLIGDMTLQTSLDKNDIAYLNHVKENLLVTYADWGREFNITRQSARARWESLRDRLYPIISAWVDYKKIKLKFLLGYVNVGKRIFLMDKLSNGILASCFGRSVGKFRSSSNELYFSFQIPSDYRCQTLLEKSFKKMVDEGLIESYRLVEVVAVSRDIDFNLYNTEKKNWIFSPEFWLNYVKYYLPEYGDFEKSPKSFTFDPYSKKIDILDLKIMDALMFDSRISSNFLAKQFNANHVTLHKKRNKLIKENFVDFYFAARNIGIVGFFMTLMEGDIEAIDRFKKACLKFPQWNFYDYIGKGSEEGTVFSFEVPIEKTWKLYSYLDDLTPDFGIKKIWHDFLSVGSRSLSNLIDRWEERRQRWRWLHNDFDLISLSEIERYV